ncbi:hypothetical protein [Ectothiorhodospira shaposhnikovii]|uniref:hypothetical protein n=1 Tax=Ectothiorhodospira shaposhnikovii TaxID=1054 RepID=UPI001EE8E322|nr:hypothetical protein [Ectothiorhodospira shaposhnikovii]MCG5512811.1 hypothetical protein [Ectothiorhodospira shaposhnikovii]
MTKTDEAVHAAVQAMINEIGELRMLVAIDSMPEKLQKARQLLRELDEELHQRANQSRLMREEDSLRQ